MLARHLLTLAATLLGCHAVLQKGPEFYFSGVSTFAHLDHHKCLYQDEPRFDIAVLGMPFDTAVSYRPGARFGPRGIRAGSSRQTSFRSFNPVLGINPYLGETRIVDCGDVELTPFDNAVAYGAMQEAYADLLARDTPSGAGSIAAMASNGRAPLAKDGRMHPRIATMGGDHSIVLPILRALHDVYGPVTVLHWDSHLDSWAPTAYGKASQSSQGGYNHGTMFYHAAQEGLVSNSSMHVGLRSLLSGTDFADYAADEALGFTYIETDEMDDLGAEGTVAAIKARVGDSPVYLSLDIDVLDPSIAPGTGTPVSGGLTTREVRKMIRMLNGLNIVGCDVVEVSPPYDSQEITALAAAEILYEMLSIMALTPLDRAPLVGHKRPDAHAARQARPRRPAHTHEEL